MNPSNMVRKFPSQERDYVRQACECLYFWARKSAEGREQESVKGESDQELRDYYRMPRT